MIVVEAQPLVQNERNPASIMRMARNKTMLAAAGI